MEVQESMLQGPVWQWEALQGMDNEDLTVSDPAKYTLEFLADGSYQLVADCNSSSGQYQVEGNSLTLVPGPMTLAECGPDSQSNEFVSWLPDVSSYTLDEQGRLVLNLADDAGSLLLAQAAESATSLEGPEWVLSGLVTEGGLTKTPVDSEITASFQDGTLAGSAGCNRYNTTYESDGSSLTLGEVATTRMACEETQMEREREFLDALSGVAGYTLDGSTLRLTDAEGQPLLVFESTS